MSHANRIVLICNGCRAETASDAPFGSSPEAVDRVRREAAMLGWSYAPGVPGFGGVDLCPKCTKGSKAQ